MVNDLIKFVNKLSEDDFRDLRKACIFRIAKSIKKVEIEDDIVEMWEVDRVEALLEVHKRFPNHGLSELKELICSRVKELEDTK